MFQGDESYAYACPDVGHAFIQSHSAGSTKLLRVMKDYTGRITLVCAQASYAMSRVDPAWSPDSLVDQWENGRLLMKSSDATRGISARKSFVNDVVTLPAAHHGQVREVPRQKVSGYVIYCE